MSEELQSIQRGQGAAFGELAGTLLPRRFASTGDEWRAVRERCGVLDVGFRGLLRATGEDRVAFLHGMVSNDVKRLQDGDGMHAALLTVQGRLVSDLYLYAVPGEIWIDAPRARLEAVRAALERYVVADDVEFAEADDVAPLVSVEGPFASRCLVAVVGEDVEGLRPLAHLEVSFDGVPLRVACISRTGEKGFTLFGPRQLAGRLWQHLCAAGAEPVGTDSLDLLRIEAGLPWYGVDVDEAWLAPEVGFEDAISYTKGCYLGQEVVERVAARGQLRRKFVGFVCEGDVVPPSGTVLFRDGAEAGQITSSVRSPARGCVIALGFAGRGSWTPGTVLQADLRGERCAVRVVDLPFVGSAADRQAEP
jgi:folate-binding protein YgfZ